MDKNDREERLVKKAMRGNVDAYGKVVDIYKEYLYKMAWLYVRNEDLALDIVQDSILKGFRSIRSLREARYFKTWMTRILINTAGDVLRKNTGIYSLETVGDVPGGGTEKIEERMDVYEAIGRLEKHYRSVIILKYFDDMKYEDMSEIFGTSVGALKASYHHAVKNFEDMKLAEIAETLQMPEGSVSAYLTRAKRELKKYLKEGYENA